MKLYITDNSGKKFWRTEVTAAFAAGERNNFAKRLIAIKSGNKAFSFVDAASAVIIEELDEYDLLGLIVDDCANDLSDDELLAELAK